MRRAVALLLWIAVAHAFDMEVLSPDKDGQPVWQKTKVAFAETEDKKFALRIDQKVEAIKDILQTSDTAEGVPAPSSTEEHDEEEPSHFVIKAVPVSEKAQPWLLRAETKVAKAFMDAGAKLIELYFPTEGKRHPQTFETTLKKEDIPESATKAEVTDAVAVMLTDLLHAEKYFAFATTANYPSESEDHDDPPNNKTFLEVALRASYLEESNIDGDKEGELEKAEKEILSKVEVALEKLGYPMSNVETMWVGDIEDDIDDDSPTPVSLPFEKSSLQPFPRVSSKLPRSFLESKSAMTRHHAAYGFPGQHALTGGISTGDITNAAGSGTLGGFFIQRYCRNPLQYKLYGVSNYHVWPLRGQAKLDTCQPSQASWGKLNAGCVPGGNCCQRIGKYFVGEKPGTTPPLVVPNLPNIGPPEVDVALTKIDFSHRYRATCTHRVIKPKPGGFLETHEPVAGMSQWAHAYGKVKHAPAPAGNYAAPFGRAPAFMQVRKHGYRTHFTEGMLYRVSNADRHFDFSILPRRTNVNPVGWPQFLDNQGACQALKPAPAVKWNAMPAGVFCPVTEPDFLNYYAYWDGGSAGGAKLGGKSVGKKSAMKFLRTFTGGNVNTAKDIFLELWQRQRVIGPFSAGGDSGSFVMQGNHAFSLNYAGTWVKIGPKAAGQRWFVKPGGGGAPVKDPASHWLHPTTGNWAQIGRMSMTWAMPHVLDRINKIVCREKPEAACDRIDLCLEHERQATILSQHNHCEFSFKRMRCEPRPGCVWRNFGCRPRLDPLGTY